jgi:hypothetical protein
MRDIALYYPYIHIRDDAWLKAAALYWPKIARLTPSGYPKYDSEAARRLSGELDFIINIEPRQYPSSVADEFIEFIRNNRKALQAKYSVPQAVEFADPYMGFEQTVVGALARGLPLPQQKRARLSPDYDGRLDTPPHPFDGNPNIGWIHIEKLTAGLAHELALNRLGVLVGSRPDFRGEPEWAVVAPGIAAVYTAALADRVASSNDLSVVTDRQGAHGILNGWDIETLAQLLLSEDQEDESSFDTDEVGALYAAVAIKTVVPARIEDIPVGRIISARRKLAPEFDAFRDHLSLLADRLTELGQIKDPSVLQARLELMVERDLRRPTQELEKKLRQLGLEPAQAVLGLKSLELPAAAAAAASAVALPAGVSQAGLVAARLVASGVQARTQRRQMLGSSPAGYLLGLEKQLTPGGIVDRLRRTFRRAGKRTRPYRS